MEVLHYRGEGREGGRKGGREGEREGGREGEQGERGKGVGQGGS